MMPMWLCKLFMLKVSSLYFYVMSITRNTGRAPIHCQPPSCTFPAVPQQQEYNIRLEVKDQLGEETATYSFNISDRGCVSFKLNETNNIILLLFYNNTCMHPCREKSNLQSEDIYSGWNLTCTGIWETFGFPYSCTPVPHLLALVSISRN